MSEARRSLGPQVAPPAAPSDTDIAELEPVLRALAIRATGDREAASDLVQEALLAVVANRSRFAGRASLRTWAVGILTHKVLDFFRARKKVRDLRQGSASVDDLAEPISDRGPERALSDRQALATLEMGFRQLPELERLAVLLVDVEGLERPEACSKLGVTDNHLRILLHRGRHRLRRVLETAGVRHAT